jgi:hypothetical protein
MSAPKAIDAVLSDSLTSSAEFMQAESVDSLQWQDVPILLNLIDDADLLAEFCRESRGLLEEVEAAVLTLEQAARLMGPATGLAFAADGERPVHLVNIPVPAYTRGDRVRELVQRDWLPALHAHRPEIIFISAGFDAHREDELASMGLIESDYAWITRQLVAVADKYAQGRIVSCLEGGYHLSALGRSVIAHLKVLAGLA